MDPWPGNLPKLACDIRPVLLKNRTIRAPAMSVTALASPSPAQVACLPGLDELDGTRVVRFDNECILIPEQCRKRSRVVTKSYSLPLWKRRSPSSDTDSADGSPVVPNASEDAHIVIKVPLPSFIVRRARSPSRACSPQVPLSPCLVHRSSSTPPSPISTKPNQMLQKPSMPRHHQRKSEPFITVPLRACCPDCVPITEECMREGEQWQVRFTHGARRRRTASLDSTTPRPSSPGLSGDVAPLTRLTITVDEVDKRRRSLDLAAEDIRRHKAPLPRPGHTDDHFPISSSNCLDLAIRSSSPKPPHRSARSSPIQEEDEDQLFPLPYPRRTPSASPASSLNIDLSPRPSPTPSRSSSVCLGSTPSPNMSSTCFSSAPAKSGTLLDESILSQSISRKASNSAINFGSGTVPVLNEPVDISRAASSSMKPPVPFPVAPPGSPSSLAPSSSSSRARSRPSLPKRTPSTSPAKQKKSKKPSFSIPFLKAGAEALKGASVDVLKGVSISGAMHSLG